MSSAPTRQLRGFGWSLNLWYVGVFLACAVVLLGLAQALLHQRLEALDARIVERRVIHLSGRYREGGVPHVQAGLGAERGDLFERLSDQRTVLGEHLPTPDLAFDALPKDGTHDVHARDGSRWTISAATLADRRSIYVGVADERRRAVLHELVVVAGYVLLVALLLAVAGGYLLTRRVRRPLAALARTAQAVAESGDLAARVPPADGPPLDDLVGLFNRMLARNETHVSTMREALDNVAHDLRTPLTRLRGAAELALTGSDPNQAREALADCVEQSDYLIAMVRTLMDITAAETGAMRLACEPVALGRLAGQVVDVYRHVADERGIELTQAGEASANADPTRLRQAVANLVDNAVKYTPEGGHVRVTVGVEDGPFVRVEDDGPGVAEADQPRVWGRLFRADRSRALPGLGLGLSYVRAIVEAHGGTVALESTEGHGARFTLRLPPGSPSG